MCREHHAVDVSLAAIGIRQPVPNARSVTFSPGAACHGAYRDRLDDGTFRIKSAGPGS